MFALLILHVYSMSLISGVGGDGGGVAGDKAATLWGIPDESVDSIFSLVAGYKRFCRSRLYVLQAMYRIDFSTNPAILPSHDIFNNMTFISDSEGMAVELQMRKLHSQVQDGVSKFVSTTPLDVFRRPLDIFQPCLQWQNQVHELFPNPDHVVFVPKP